VELRLPNNWLYTRDHEICALDETYHRSPVSLRHDNVLTGGNRWSTSPRYAVDYLSGRTRLGVGMPHCLIIFSKESPPFCFCYCRGFESGMVRTGCSTRNRACLHGRATVLQLRSSQGHLYERRNVRGSLLIRYSSTTSF
jgi:hypothetical protein